MPSRRAFRSGSPGSVAVAVSLAVSFAVSVVVTVVVAIAAGRGVAILLRLTRRHPARAMLPMSRRHAIDRRGDVARLDHTERSTPAAGTIPVAVAEFVPVRADAEVVVVPGVGIVHHVDAILRDE